TEIEFISNTEIRGYKHSNGAAGNRKVYFYARFSKPLDAYGIAVGDSITQEKGKKTGKNIKAYGSFDVRQGESVEVKVALSFISYGGARKNFDAEAAAKGFDLVRRETEDKWREKLSKIE